MSIDVAFQPKGPTVLVTNSATQVIPPGTGPGGMVSFRIVNMAAAAAAQRLGWADTAAKASSSAPGGAGLTNAVNSINVEGNGVLTLELPATTFFIAAAATGFEVTPGQGATSA